MIKVSEKGKQYKPDDLDVTIVEVKDKSYTKLSPELLQANELAFGGCIV